MTKKAKLLKKTILIVCEGEATEPNYFQRLREIVYNKFRILDQLEDISIVISPIPKSEREEIFTTRPGGRRRTTQNVVVKDDEPLIEEENKPQPLCYVRKAQILGLIDNQYSEVWAVYDKDQHTKHEEAIELSTKVINEKTIKIGFSSVAFEYWILLHFNLSKLAFEKSMCRGKDLNGKKEYYFCGAHQHKNECTGQKCVCGEIVSKGYLQYENKRKDFNFDAYHPNVEAAIANALSLRQSYSGTQTPIYQLNPYTDIYRLVFKLLHLPIEYTWFEFQNVIIIEDVSYDLSFSNNILSIKVTNSSQTTFILQTETFSFVEVNGKHTIFGQRVIINPGQSITINSQNISGSSAFKFVCIKEFNDSYFITELP